MAIGEARDAASSSRMRIAAAASLFLSLSVAFVFLHSPLKTANELIALPFDPNLHFAQLSSDGHAGVSYLAKAIVNEMTQNPDDAVGPGNEGSLTTDLAQKPSILKSSSVVPSKMMSLLRKALMEQKHDESDHRKELEQAQQYLKKQESSDGKPRMPKQVEDPNVALAKYIEEEERKSKLAKKQKWKKQKSKVRLVSHHAPKPEKLESPKVATHSVKKPVLKMNADKWAAQGEAVKHHYEVEMAHEIAEWREANSTVENEQAQKLALAAAEERERLDRIADKERRALAAIQHLRVVQAAREARQAIERKHEEALARKQAEELRRKAVEKEEEKEEEKAQRVKEAHEVQQKEVDDQEERVKQAHEIHLKQVEEAKAKETKQEIMKEMKEVKEQMHRKMLALKAKLSHLGHVHREAAATEPSSPLDADHDDAPVAPKRRAASAPRHETDAEEKVREKVEKVEKVADRDEEARPSAKKDHREERSAPSEAADEQEGSEKRRARAALERKAAREAAAEESQKRKGRKVVSGQEDDGGESEVLRIADRELRAAQQQKSASERKYLSTPKAEFKFLKDYIQKIRFYVPSPLCEETMPKTEATAKEAAEGAAKEEEEAVDKESAAVLSHGEDDGATAARRPAHAEPQDHRAAADRRSAHRQHAAAAAQGGHRQKGDKGDGDDDDVERRIRKAESDRDGEGLGGDRHHRRASGDDSDKDDDEADHDDDGGDRRAASRREDDPDYRGDRSSGDDHDSDDDVSGNHRHAEFKAAGGQQLAAARHGEEDKDSHLSTLLRLSRDVEKGHDSAKETELAKLQRIRREIISDYTDVTKKGRELEHFATTHRLRANRAELAQENPAPW